jgi:hypothetical protein
MREHLAKSQQLIAADYERGSEAGSKWAATADEANCKRISLLIQRGSARGEPYISQSIPEVFQVLAPPVSR